MMQRFVMEVTDEELRKSDAEREDMAEKSVAKILEEAERTEEFSTISQNGSKVITATINIEIQMERIIVDFFFPVDDNPPDPRRLLFQQRFLESTLMDFSKKKEIVQTIVGGEDLLEGSEKAKLQKNLKSLMTWRNAFAHGRLDNRLGGAWHLCYFSSAKQDQLLEDAFWTEVEKVFRSAHDALVQIHGRLLAKNLYQRRNSKGSNEW